MTEFRKLSESFYAAAQIEPSDVARAAEDGFASLISNRLDGEAPGQPSAADMAQLAKGAGLAFHHIPIRPGAVTAEDLDRFEQASASGQTLAFCASGARSALLWAFVQARAGAMAVDDILRATAAAGFDFSAQRPTLEQLAKAAAGQG